MSRLSRLVAQMLARSTLAVLVLILAIWFLALTRPDVQQLVLQYNVLLMIVVGLLLLAEIAYPRKTSAPTSLLSTPTDLSVVADQRRANTLLRTIAKSRQPTHCDLIEYSSVTVAELLESLRDANASIRLLLQNPDAAVTDYQRQRITQRMRDLATVDFRNYERIGVRVYNKPASFRGRSIDDKVVCLSWYTYEDTDVGVRGHDNPCVIATTNTREGRIMQAAFSRAFQQLWDSAEEVDLSDLRSDVFHSEASIAGRTQRYGDETGTATE